MGRHSQYNNKIGKLLILSAVLMALAIWLLVTV